MCKNDYALTYELLQSESNEENGPKPGGARAGKHVNVYQYCKSADERLNCQYFTPNVIYVSTLFNRYFKISETFFQKFSWHYAHLICSLLCMLTALVGKATGMKGKLQHLD